MIDIFDAGALDMTPNRNPSGGRMYGLRPSVTTVLKVMERPFFADYRKKVGEEAADEKMHRAQALGTAVHRIAEGIARGTPMELPPEMEHHAQAIRDFLEKHVDEVLGTEMELVSEHHGFGGMCDLYCKLKGGALAVVDYKTTASLTRTHGVQLAGYALLLTEHGHRVQRRLAVRVKKEEGAEGKYYARTYLDHKEDVDAFLSALALWNWENRGKLKKLAEAL
jgi:predicted RecB family nuclease